MPPNITSITEASSQQSFHFLPPKESDYVNGVAHAAISDIQALTNREAVDTQTGNVVPADEVLSDPPKPAYQLTYEPNPRTMATVYTVVPGIPGDRVVYHQEITIESSWAYYFVDPNTIDFTIDVGHLVKLIGSYILFKLSGDQRRIVLKVTALLAIPVKVKSFIPSIRVKCMMASVDMKVWGTCHLWAFKGPPGASFLQQALDEAQKASNPLCACQLPSNHNSDEGVASSKHDSDEDGWNLFDD